MASGPDAVSISVASGLSFAFSSNFPAESFYTGVRTSEKFSATKYSKIL
jgi:hypothetical protein